MERGSYVAASGGIKQLRHLDIATNNLANASTVGFKKAFLLGAPQSFDDTLAKGMEALDPFARDDHVRSPSTIHLQTITDFSPGPISATGMPLDVAPARENEFFVVKGKDGDLLYTRAGNFTLTGEGALVTQDGLAVQGDGGEIAVNSPNVIISSNGAVVVDKQTIGRIQMVRIENPLALERVDGTRFRAVTAEAQVTPLDNVSLVPESLELSNTSVVSGMIDMITANRGFEMYAKVSQTIDELNQVAVSRVGKRR
jgi:flagellar basal body rod protein FlgG